MAALLDSVFSFNPQDSMTYYNEGVAFEALGKSKEARWDCRKANDLRYK